MVDAQLAVQCGRPTVISPLELQDYWATSGLRLRRRMRWQMSSCYVRTVRLQAWFQECAVKSLCHGYTETACRAWEGYLVHAINITSTKKEEALADLCTIAQHTIYFCARVHLNRTRPDPRAQPNELEQNRIRADGNVPNTCGWRQRCQDPTRRSWDGRMDCLPE